MISVRVTCFRSKRRIKHYAIDRRLYSLWITNFSLQCLYSYGNETRFGDCKQNTTVTWGRLLHSALALLHFCFEWKQIFCYLFSHSYEEFVRYFPCLPTYQKFKCLSFEFYGFMSISSISAPLDHRPI